MSNNLIGFNGYLISEVLKELNFEIKETNGYPCANKTGISIRFLDYYHLAIYIKIKGGVWKLVYLLDTTNYIFEKHKQFLINKIKLLERQMKLESILDESRR
jgi:hypothetical protein